MRFFRAPKMNTVLVIWVDFIALLFHKYCGLVGYGLDGAGIESL